MRVVAIAAWLGCVGCNAIFGLDQTHRATGGADAMSDAVPSADADPNDLDGDGVANEKDDCPNVANHDQADEDGDGLGDLCDNCPEVPNADQADVREGDKGLPPDGIGDVCDPNPELDGDVRALFEPFNDPARLADWKLGAGSWSEANGALHQSAVDLPATLAYYDRDVHLPAIRVIARVEGTSATQTDLAAGGWLAIQRATVTGTDTTTPDGYLCEALEPVPAPPAGAQAEIVHYISGLAAMTTGASTNQAAGLASLLTFTATVDEQASGAHCAVGVDGAVANVNAQDAVFLATGAAGLYTSNVAVAFQSVTIYTR